jgi:hypothetical protein
LAETIQELHVPYKTGNDPALHKHGNEVKVPEYECVKPLTVHELPHGAPPTAERVRERVIQVQVLKELINRCLDGYHTLLEGQYGWVMRVRDLGHYGMEFRMLVLL